MYIHRHVKISLNMHVCIYIYIVDVVEWSRALDVRLSEWCLQCINGVGSNPVEGRTKI